MKIITSIPNRNTDSNIYLKSGKFAYKVESSWAKWPDEIKGYDVLCLICDKNDNLYATTSHPDNPICVFNSQGDFIRSFGKGLFLRPHSISFTSQGTVLCADSSLSLHVVREIDLDGNLVRTFGTPGVPSDTGYNADIFIKTDTKEIMTEDQQSLNRLNAKLDTIEKAGKPFNRPCHMVEAQTGEMFAADGYGNAVVHKFASDGTYLETWGGRAQA